MADLSSPVQTKADASKQASVIAEVQESDEPHRDISGDVIEDGLRRGLKGRHFMIIALGSIIGPGCFYGLGYGIYEAGPLGLLIGFSIVGESFAIINTSKYFHYVDRTCRSLGVDFDAKCWRDCYAFPSSWWLC